MAKELSFVVSDPVGLHARPATILVNQASKFTSNIKLVYNDKEMLVCEVKAELYRAVSLPDSEPSVNGPKDSFNENIVMNLGLIKRRIKSEKLINEDFFIGRESKTKLSLLYIKGIAKKKHVEFIQKKLEALDIDGLVDIESLHTLIGDQKDTLPTILKTERPDKVSSALLEGKIVLIADNSPYALIMPAFFVDFINPQGDLYVKPININFLKVLRFSCLFITILLPALYISIINYNQEAIPLNLLLSFQSARNGVPFPSAFEAIFMIFVCSILRESDIRFPSSYGSSISILGALILGEAAVNANIASPIMIIVIAFTFITSLIFTETELVDAARYFRIIFLFAAALYGLYGIVLAFIYFLIHVIEIKTLDEPYFYPLAPFDLKYLMQGLLKNNFSKNTERSPLLTEQNFTKQRRIDK